MRWVCKSFNLEREVAIHQSACACSIRNHTVNSKHLSASWISEERASHVNICCEEKIWATRWRERKSGREMQIQPRCRRDLRCELENKVIRSSSRGDWVLRPNVNWFERGSCNIVEDLVQRLGVTSIKHVALRGPSKNFHWIWWHWSG